MFLNHTMRPAVAHTGMGGNETSNDTLRRDSMAFQNGASEAEDFHAFHQGAGRDEVRRRPQPRNGGRPTNNKKPMIVAVCIAAALLLLILLVVGVALSGDGHVTFDDNAYIAYADGDGNFYVSVNGSVIDYKFEGEVEVLPAADHSFAYVTDTSAEGVQIFVLNGKKLETVTTSPVEDAIAFASLKPGVIFQENGKIYLYSEEVGEEMITKDPTADNFMISGDASTVVYTEAVENSAGETQLHLYQDGSSDKLQKNISPVAVSNYGDYIYVKKLGKDGTYSLYTITAKDRESLLIEKSEGFTAITNVNVKGDEILFCTLNGTDVYTCLYRFDDHETIQLSKSYLTPAEVDPSIAIYGSFKNTYMESVNLSLTEGVSNATFYLNKKFEIVKISSFSGEFDNEGKYFYYINGDKALIQLDLSDENLAKSKIDDDVIDFAVTEKGNVYSLNEQNQLRFYKVSTEKKFRIADEITTISMHDYANEIYFTMSDDVDVSVFTSKEGSDEEIAKWGSTQITSVPFFSNGGSKKTYAYYYDIDSGWMLFYTSNGKSFKLISNDCGAINGVEIPDSVG